jgi:hypothetical protein
MRRPEFPLFPHRIFRPNPPFLEGNLSNDTVDPWAKRGIKLFYKDAWRYDKFFSAKHRLSRMFPGLGIGLFALALYIRYDKWYTESGPGKAEAEKWDKFMKEREHRLEHHH